MQIAKSEDGAERSADSLRMRFRRGALRRRLALRRQRQRWKAHPIDGLGFPTSASLAAPGAEGPWWRSSQGVPPTAQTADPRSDSEQEDHEGHAGSSLDGSRSMRDLLRTMGLGLKTLTWCVLNFPVRTEGRARAAARAAELKLKPPRPQGESSIPGVSAEFSLDATRSSVLPACRLSEQEVSMLRDAVRYLLECTRIHSADDSAHAAARIVRLASDEATAHGGVSAVRPHSVRSSLALVASEWAPGASRSDARTAYHQHALDSSALSGGASSLSASSAGS